MTNENKQFVLNELSGNKLLIRYRNGDEDAFREVVSRYKNSLYTFLRQLTDNLEVVGYAFQEAFLQLYTSYDSIDTNHPLRPWLFNVAANKVKDVLKNMQRRSCHEHGILANSGDAFTDEVINALQDNRIQKCRD